MNRSGHDPGAARLFCRCAYRAGTPGPGFMPFHYREAAANLLTNDALDPHCKISGGPRSVPGQISRTGLGPGLISGPDFIGPAFTWVQSASPSQFMNNWGSFYEPQGIKRPLVLALLELGLAWI